ncbi:hypothetical protein [Cryptosporangium japonicum]|uniref:hypothetical protein n=1 Tax=Cryptosporangium japonicum TaxID=80872 RepID=UPI0031DA03AF
MTVGLERYLGEFLPPLDASVLVDATAWCEDEPFWPAFLGSVGGSVTAPLAFEVEPADVEEYLDELHDPDHWPYLTLGLAQGHRLHLLFRNCEDDSGWDYLFEPAGRSEVWTLAALEGGYVGPGLSWPELVSAAGTSDAARRLLLMLPALGDSDRPDTAGARVAAAFVAVGGAPEQAGRVADELLGASGRFWGDESWVDHDGRRICVGDHSPRRLGAPDEHLLAMAAALT